MLSCFSLINSYFDQWHVRKQSLKTTHSSIVEEIKIIVEERIVERHTCFALNKMENDSIAYKRQLLNETLSE